MAGPSIRDLVLEAFQDDLAKELRVADVLVAVQRQLPDADTASIRAKLSELVHEGVVDLGKDSNAKRVQDGLKQLTGEGVVAKLARGQYALMEVQVRENPLEAAAAQILGRVLKPNALRRAVIWDATPYLSQAEDGAPGTRLVIEHAAALQLKDAIESDWSSLAPKATGSPGKALQRLAWIAHRRGPLGELLWGPDTPGPSVIDVGVILVPEERLGGTGLTRKGYRHPTHERIMAEFLAEELDSAAAHDILRAGLMHKDFSIRRAEQAARSLGAMHRLWMVLAAAQPSMPEPARSQVLAHVPAYVRGFLETNE